METLSLSLQTKKFYESVEALQADLDEWLRWYNSEHPHRGYRNVDRTQWEASDNTCRDWDLSDEAMPTKKLNRTSQVDSSRSTGCGEKVPSDTGISPTALGKGCY